MNETSKSKTNAIVVSAAIAAVYAALTMALAPISYGPIQMRVSETLCILPFFFPGAVWGLFIGCLIANLMSVLGVLDIVFGSLATLLAAICTAAIGRRARRDLPEGGIPSWGACIAACAMPVIFNAIIIGAVLAYTLSPEAAVVKGFAVFGLEVGVGEAIVMFLVGLPVMRILLKNRKAMELFQALER